jgi:hypothetical protein
MLGTAMNFTEHHPVVKDDGELASESGDDENEYEEENTYRPRPRLPKPFVSMRNLASLISRLIEHSK